MITRLDAPVPLLQVYDAPPGATSYGLRQLNVKDPDGYELCFRAPLA